MKALPIVILALVLAACSHNPFNKQKSPEETTATKPSAPAQDIGYIIQPGDILNISVWKEKDLEKEVLVRPDGGLTFPLAGDIQAAGMTIEAFRDELTNKLKRYIPRPVVTVSTIRVLGNQIFVIGKVNKPGVYTLGRNVDVMQALSIAGGLSVYASENKIKILRRVNGKQHSFRFQYSKVKKGKNLEQNIILQSGDTIVVR